MSSSTQLAEATLFLESLLGKTLHVYIPDGRLFTGVFKCTDNESNIILSNSFEYRMPSRSVEQRAMQTLTNPDRSTTNAPTPVIIKADMTSRFVGLIVIPGNQIARLELEERKTQPLVIRPSRS